MAEKNREIEFIIKMRNEARKGMLEFSSDIQMMKNAVVDLNKSLGTKEGRKELTSAATAIKGFMTAISSATKKDSYAGFVDIANSIHQISTGLDYARGSVKSFASIVSDVTAIGAKLRATKEDAQAFGATFKNIATSIKEMGAVDATRLNSISSMFENMSKAGKSQPETGIVKSLEKIKETEPQILSVAQSIKTIADALSSGEFLAGARELKNALSIGIGGGGGGGGGLPIMGYTNWGEVSEGSAGKKLYEGFLKMHEKTGGTGHVGAGIPAGDAVQKLLDSMKFEQKETGISFMHPSTLGGALSGMEYAEDIPKEIVEYGMKRGTALHSVVENIIKQINMKHQGMGEFLKKYQAGEERWIKQWDNFAKTEARDAEQNFRRLAIKAAEESEIFLDKGAIKAINASAKRVRNDVIRTFGSDPNSLFGRLLKRVAEKAGGSAKVFGEILNNLSVESEKEIQFAITDPGGKVSGQLSTELRKASLKYIKESVMYWKERLGVKSPLFKELVSYMRKVGASIKGTADIIVQYGPGMGADVIDIKTGGTSPAAQRYSRNQIIPYQIGVAEQLGIPLEQVGGYAYRTTKQEMEVSGTGLSEAQMRFNERSLEIDKKESEELKKQKQDIEEIARLQAEVADLTEKEGAGRARITQLIEKYEAKLVEARESNNAIASSTEAIASAGTTAAGAAGAGGVGGVGGGAGGVGGIGVSGFLTAGLLSRRDMADRGDISGMITAMSKFDQAITSAYIKQEMLGQKVDMTKVKMEEYRRIIDELSVTIGKYVSLEHTGDKQLITRATHLEKLTSEMGLYEQKLQKSITTGNQMLELQDKIRTKASTLVGVKESPARRVESMLGGVTDLKEFETISKASLKEFEGTTFTTTESKKIGQLSNLIEQYKLLGAQMKNLDSQHKGFTESLRLAVAGEEKQDTKLRTLVDTVMSVHPQYGKLKGEVLSLGDAMRLLSEAVGINNQEFLRASVSSEIVGNKLKEMQIRFEATGASTKNWNQGIHELRAGMRALNVNIEELKNIETALNSLIDIHTNKLIKLNSAQIKDRDAIKAETDARKGLMDQLKVVDSAMMDYQKKHQTLSMMERRELDRTSESFRGIIRTQLKGFTDMMRSQMAWVAGYGLMFGALRGFKAALGSVITIEYEFARAMRTARNEAETGAQMLEKYESEGVRAMLKFGKTSGEVGEVLYQLGSAGLNTKENLAALNSTMNMLVATEGDVTESTKMVASVYNNFGDIIAGVSTLSEKFKYINDVMVATFRDHQVELNELREGYKHLMAMGKVANLTFVEMSGILGTLNDHMIKSGIAGRSVQTILSRISKEPYKFAEAFGVIVDPDKPLELISLINEIGKSMKSQGMSVEDVGVIFDRMGLRGAKAFVTLIQNSKELEMNIMKLELTSENAAKNMAMEMLTKPNVAFARLRETIAALIREGFSPLVTIAHATSVVVAGTGMAVFSLNDSLKSILSSIVKIISLYATFTAFGIVLRSLSARFAKNAADMGFLSEKAALVSNAFRVAAVNARGLAVALTLKHWSIARMHFDNLGAAIMGSAAMFKIFLGLLLLYGAYKVWDYFTTTKEEYMAMTGEITSSISEGYEEIKILNEKIRGYKELGKEMQGIVNVTEEIRRVSISNLLLNIEGGFSLLSEATSEFIGELDRLKGTFKSYSSRSEEDLAKLGVMPFFSKKKVLVGIRESIIEEVGNSLSQMIKIQNTIVNIRKFIKENAKDLEYEQIEIAEHAIFLLQGLIDKLSKAAQEASRMVGKAYGVRAKAEVERPPVEEGLWMKELAKATSAKEYGNLETALKEISKYEGESGKLVKWSKQFTGMTQEAAVKHLKDRYASIEAGLVEQKLEEKIMQGLKKYFDLLVNVVELERQRRKEIDSQVKSYEKLENTLQRQNIKSLKDMISYAPLKTLLTIDDTTTENVERVTRDIQTIIEQIQTGTKGQREGVLKALGFSPTDIDGAFKRLDKLRIKYQKIEEAKGDLEKNRARLQMQYDERNATIEQTRAIEDLIYEMDRYHSYEAQISRFIKEHLRNMADLNFKISEQKDKYKDLEKQIEFWIENEGIGLDLRKEELKRLDEAIKRMIKERDLKEEINYKLEKELKLRLKIEDLRNRQSRMENVAEYQMRTGKYGEALQSQYMTEALDYAARKAETIQKYEAAIGKSTDIADQVSLQEELNSLLLNMEEDFQRKKFETYKSWSQRYYEEEYARLMGDAEIKRENATSIGEYFESTWLSMKAGISNYLSEQKTFTESMAGMTYDTLNIMSDALTQKTLDWLNNSEEAAMSWNDVLKETLLSIQNSLVKYIQKLIEVYIWQQLVGMIPSFRSTQTATPATTTGTTTGVSMGFGSFAGAPQQYGGLLRGGIPGKDSIPILGMAGEYMIPRDSVDYYGIKLFERLRNKEIIKMQSGGSVGGVSTSSNSGGYSGSIKTIQVNVKNESGQPMEASDVDFKFDFDAAVVDVVVRKATTSKSFKRTINTR